MAASIAGGTSFHKKVKSSISQIRGVRPSLQNNQLLISTGVPSIDAVIGGGLAVGTAMLIEEDTYASYARLLFKYFLAEGIVGGQSVFVATSDVHPEQILKELPGPILDNPELSKEKQYPEPDKETMKIAWRYQHKPEVTATPTSSKFGHYYDMTQSISADTLNSADIRIFHTSEQSIESPAGCFIQSPHYQELLSRIKSHISEDQFSAATVRQQNKKVLRIGILSLGSPLWNSSEKFEDEQHSLLRFLYGLRSLLRASFSTALITVPTHLFQDPALTRRIEKLGDTVIHLESFVGSEKETNPVYKDYHGLFNILKLPRLNSLLCHMPESLDLAFKLKRKKFTVEKLHLPPELSDTASRPQEDPVKGACGSGASSKLDF